MYYDIIQSHKKRVIAIAVVVLIVIIGWAITLYASRIGKLPVVLAVVPSDATITVGSQQYGNGTQWITPGKYIISVKKDGFEPAKKSIEVTDKKSQNVIAVSLKARSESAKKWVMDNQKDYSSNEQYGAIAANVEGKYFSDKNPITTKLPFRDPYFTIGYIVNDDDSITLTIATPSPRYRFYAVDKIRSLGYDPTDFTIVFKDFRNPLGEGIE